MRALGQPQHFPQLCQDLHTQSGKAASPHGCLTFSFLLYTFPTFQPQDVYFWCFSLINSSNKPSFTKDNIKTLQACDTCCYKTVHSCCPSWPVWASAAHPACQAQQPPHTRLRQRHTAGPPSHTQNQFFKKQNSTGRCQLTCRKYLFSQAKRKQTKNIQAPSLSFFT